MSERLGPNDIKILPNVVVEGTSVAAETAIDKSPSPPNTAPSAEPLPLASVYPLPTREYRGINEDALRKAGLDTAFIDPTPLYVGKTKTVYPYDNPQGNNRVLIVRTAPPLSSSIKTGLEEKDKFEIAKKYFTDKYVPETEFFTDEQTGITHILQDRVDGHGLDSRTAMLHPEMRWQLGEIGVRNEILYKEKGLFLDFLGQTGISSWINRKMGKLAFKDKDVVASNIRINTENRLKITDFQFYDMNYKSLMEKVGNWLGITLNRMLMKHYFRVTV